MMRTTPIRLSLRVPGIFLGVVLLLMATSAQAQVQSKEESYTQRSQDGRQALLQPVSEISTIGARASALALISDFRLGPDDLVDISVFEAPELNRTLRVSANGEISLELLGPIRASGLTPRELETTLQDRLRRTYMKDPHVGVFVHELESHPVSVVGAVKKSGVFQIRSTKTVIEMISLAEGLSDTAGDTVLIMRGTEFSGLGASEQVQQGKIEQVNLKELMESKDSALNVLVYPGDIVKVTSAEVVYVVGEVRKPGGFVLKNNQNISLLQALALAEGLTRTSATSQARIIRTVAKTDQRIEIPVDLGKILSNKKSDLELQPKDILFIPNSAAKSAFYRAAEAAISTATGAAIYKW
jgi:polysaccharide export outer membrane protein